MNTSTLPNTMGYMLLKIQDSNMIDPDKKRKQASDICNTVKELARQGMFFTDELRGIASTCINELGQQETITLEEIQEIVCQQIDIEPQSLHSKTRVRPVVKARQMIMYFAKIFTKHSLRIIGDFFGGFDHTTVIHSCQTVEDLMTSDKNYLWEIEQIRFKIMGKTTIEL